MSTGAQDGKLFTRGKVQELRVELQAADAGKKDKAFSKKKTVLKKIVANMTMGNDMTPLFPDIIMLMQIQVLEIKKMVYLFLINYGRSKPDDTQHAIPSFLTDAEDRNPLIRALAIRTMSSIPLPSIIKALSDPLRHALRDSDPYVRKTAAIAVAKLHPHSAASSLMPALIPLLRDLLADPNPTVVANSVAALSEISERSDEIALRLTYSVGMKLVSALGECSEWGQIYILDSLLSFTPQSSLDAETLAERIAARLQHSNSAVVLVTVKVILYLMNYMGDGRDGEVVRGLERKMGPPLVTLLSSGPEVQYVALRSILLIIQRRPAILANEVKVFFVKYNDPIYVKLAKLEIMYRLVGEKNYKEVLEELKEYASEVDVDFVRKSVRSIGRLAIKIPSSATPCIQALLALISTKISYVVQEATVVIKDIFRCYPGKYESVIGTLCENMDVLDEPEAKSAMIWILGEYADRIENSDELLEDFLFGFMDESTEVQLALLTATVKLFIKRPTAGQELVPKVLKMATEDAENPDLRDRGFMYWRLLSTDPAAARDIVLAEKPPISTETDRMDRSQLDQLLLHTGTLSSIYHKSPQTFIRTARAKYLPDSPALNPSTRRHLLTPGGYAATVAPVPRPTTASVPTPAATSQQQIMDEEDDDEEAEEAARRRRRDPYGDLGVLESEDQYTSDVARPQGGDDDLLF